MSTRLQVCCAVFFVFLMYMAHKAQDWSIQPLSLLCQAIITSKGEWVGYWGVVEFRSVQVQFSLFIGFTKIYINGYYPTVEEYSF